MTQNIPETESDLWRKQIGDLLKSGKYVLERDGWTMFEAEHFIEAGFPKDFIEPLVETETSDGTWKGSYWKDENKGIIAHGKMQEAARKIADNNDGKMPDDWLELVPRDVVEQYSAVFIPELKGVNYLHFLRALEKLFEVESQSFFGRGSQAGGIIKGIQEKLQY